MRSFYEFDVTRLDGKPDLLGPLAGKVVLAVNVASRCGLTPQYTDLEGLHEELAGENFSVVGFPCNQFGAQEPGSEREHCSRGGDSLGMELVTRRACRGVSSTSCTAMAPRLAPR